MRPKFVLYFQMVMFATGLALVAAGCAQTGDVPGTGTDASVTDTPLGDADIGGETFVPAPCAPVSGDPTLLRLKGTVWTGDVLLPEGEVFVSATTGLVLCVSEDCSDVEGADSATVVCTDGIITPGLVNPHDHANYNHLPRWQHVKRYKNRYEWQADPTYHTFKAPQSETFYKAKCETMKWAELRGLVSGTTAMQGTSGGACIQGWVRDLDEPAANGLDGYSIYTQVTKLSGVSDATVKKWQTALQSGATSGVVLHLAEGIDTLSRDEWSDLAAKGLVQEGVKLIHATGLTGVELAEARQHGVDLIWSPQSNLDLYGDTTRVPAALNLGVRVAIGPDWTPSGSMNMLDELKCAKKLSAKRWGGRLSDEQLVRMATVESASAVGAGDWLGRLATGYIADVAVFSGDRGNPFAAVIAARPETTRLVLVGGRPLYGDAALMADISSADCEPLDVCGAAKVVCAKDSSVDGGSQSVADIRSKLESTLANAKAADSPTPAFEYAYNLWPLFFCGAEADALIQCDVAGGPAVSPSAKDLDGDGKANEVDKCPNAFDPDQGDLDSDGVGDACDPCPLASGDAECPQPGPGDQDGDGVADEVDNCPDKPNAAQEDADDDGKGDTCDACPKGANPGDAPCPSKLVAVDVLNQDGGVYPEGDLVKIENLYVTGAVAQKGTTPPTVWAQAEPVAPWGGIALQLPKSTKITVKVGDRIVALGKVANFYGLKALSDTSIQVLDGGHTVTPWVETPATLCKAPGSLPFRSLLVEVQDVTVQASNADEAAGNDYGELLLEGGLRVGDDLITWGKTLDRPQTGDTFSLIRGILTLSYGTDKLLPRSADDFAP
ncbi:MAG: amidohydrolase family protein [Myxococcota bacterium]